MKRKDWHKKVEGNELSEKLVENECQHPIGLEYLYGLRQAHVKNAIRTTNNLIMWKYNKMFKKRN